MKISILTWILSIFGVITFLPLMLAQLLMLLSPDSKQARDLIIGKGETWRDDTHYRSALAFAWADILILLPLFIISYWGIFSGQEWGYILWLVLGIISIYFSIIFWVQEKAYVLPSCGRLVYYTYFWGSFLYWGIGVSVYSLSIIL